MKSFATLLLAATVSANYCYTDGCNCNGARRACYSLPRQNMRPAVNTCCPVGVQPTVYGRNNGRSVNIPQTTSLMLGATEDTWSPTARLNADCAATFQARQCAQVFQARGCRQLGLGNARKECEKNAGDVRKECEKNAADVRKECEKGAVDAPMETQEPKQVDFSESEEAVAVERNQGDCAAIFQARQCAQVFQARGCRQLGLGNARKECEKNAGDARKECEKNAGDARKECEKAQVSNLQVYGGGQPNTHLAKLDEISVETKNTENTLNEDGFSGHTKNSRYSWTQDADGKPVIVWENKRGSRFGINTSLFSKEHKEKMGKTDGSWNPRDSLAWNEDKCSAYCATYGSYPPTKCTRYDPCVVAPAQTSELSSCGGGDMSGCWWM